MLLPCLEWGESMCRTIAGITVYVLIWLIFISLNNWYFCVYTQYIKYRDTNRVLVSSGWLETYLQTKYMHKNQCTITACFGVFTFHLSAFLPSEGEEKYQHFEGATHRLSEGHYHCKAVEPQLQMANNMIMIVTT